MIRLRMRAPFSLHAVTLIAETAEKGTVPFMAVSAIIAHSSLFSKEVVWHAFVPGVAWPRFLLLPLRRPQAQRGGSGAPPPPPTPLSTAVAKPDARVQKLKEAASADVAVDVRPRPADGRHGLQLRRARLSGVRDAEVPHRHPRDRTASPSTTASPAFRRPGWRTGDRASRSSRLARTSTASRRRRRSRASRIAIRSSTARPGTARATTPARRSTSSRRSPSSASWSARSCPARS